MVGLPKKVCIIGAGISGLSVALNLRESGYQGMISVFEREGRSGGRILSRPGKGGITIFDLGAGRFNKHHHPGVSTLCLKFGLELEPFDYQVNYRASSNGSTLMEKADLRTLVQTIVEHLSASALQGEIFSAACKRIVAEKDFRKLCMISGYDTLNNPRLSVAGGLAILLHHPETQCLLNGKMDNWYRIKNGFQSVIEATVSQAQTCGISIRYGCSLRDITSRDEYGVCIQFDTPDGETSEGCDMLVLASPPRHVVKILTRNESMKAHLPKPFVDIPVTKVFFEFNRPWWNDYGFYDSCVIADSSARKLYLSDTNSVAWFMCDGPSALEVYQDLTAAERSPLNFISQHLGVTIPGDVELVSFDYKFWAEAVSFCPQNDDATPSFHKVAHNIVMCSDTFTDSMGWVEGSLQSARAVSNHILNTWP